MKNFLLTTITLTACLFTSLSSNAWYDSEYEYEEFRIFAQKFYCYKSAQKNLELPVMCEDHGWVTTTITGCAAPFVISYKYTNDNVLPYTKHCPVGNETTCEANPDLCSSVPTFGSD